MKSGAALRWAWTATRGTIDVDPIGPNTKNTKDTKAITNRFSFVSLVFAGIP
jgi:hypothetical protein